jgi:nickel/cobalt transporter (NicO) family protein
MPSFAELLQQGAGHAWLFVPSAVLLGVLHGLEPGHSKTMMAAFIVAIRGTVLQAVLLGLAATVSHTLVVWAIALGGMYLWQGLDTEHLEPYFQLASAAIIIAIALWMLRRTWAEGSRPDHHHHHHDHSHHEERRRVETPHGAVTLEIFEEGVPPRWRLHSEVGHVWRAADLSLTTLRPDGSYQRFAFKDRGSYVESIQTIPEPHEFTVRLSLGHGGEFGNHELLFAEHGSVDHHHDDGHDAHALAHARDIERRFATRDVTTIQIVLFGLTGGLIPCPAAITILLICLQFKHLALGAVLVLCFSIGLAITLVSVGVAAALGAQQAAQRFSWFGSLMQRAPYLSSSLIILVGLYTAWQGWHGLA